MPDTFTEFMDFLLEIEGHHSNDPDDRGGDTYYGISRNAHPDIPWPPTKTDAIKIYRAHYWDALQCDQLPPQIAWMVAGAAVQHGVHRSALQLQAALGVKNDGRIGPKTIAAAQAAGPGLVTDLLSRRARLYTKICMKTPSQVRFARGWHRRLFLLHERVMEMSNG